MRLQKINGFIVYGFPLGEADQLVSCFTSSGNLVKFVAKGSRKVKSKSAAAVQLFILGQYIIYRGKGLPILRQADIMDSFSPLRQDWAKCGAAFAAMELCRLLIAEEAREVDAFKLLLAYMLHLKTNPYDPIVFDSFRLKFAAYLGYEMNFSSCSQCGRPLQSGWLYWPAGGAVCSVCKGPARLSIRKEDLSLLHTLGSRDFSYLQGKFPSQGKAATEIIDSLINWLTEGKTKAQAFRPLFES
ncbi:MAG TPA: DNA repair protein RecO [Bacillota bacterium]|nr:DNA repair protein RecO [Bacillota bacterium]HOC06028.1 DNA repair protein RecO [Bacillota bacterium]HPZ21529.1 DNA repair protein RecO [Bacillota bacterium]HQD19604.1 DNA repair protein RecO [Bacillota bacterium]